MRIKQCYLSSTVRKGGKFFNFFNKYGFQRYHNPNEPAFFFGLYTYQDLDILRYHNALAVIIWRGGDSMRGMNLKQAKKHPSAKHIAISSFIAEDLDRAGIAYKSIPIVGSNVEKITPTPLGDKIYAYVPKDGYYFYGGDIIDKIRQACKYKIIVSTGPTRYTKSKLFKIYDKCFCGLRLTKHDGAANTVVELGLKGRMCFYNGNVPNAIHWSRDDVPAILDAIERESQKIGSTDTSLYEKMQQYLDIGEDWLNTKYWKQS